MEKNLDLCSCRDGRGRKWYTRVPGGTAAAGMYIRLVGGIFVLAEAVTPGGEPGDDAPLCAAAEVLQSKWRKGDACGA